MCALQTSTTPEGPGFSFGPFHFDSASGLLANNGSETVLPSRASGVLRTLLERSNELVSKRELLTSVWKDAHVTESSLTDAVSCLRHALDDDPREPRYIQTIHRRGYRFVGEVSRGRLLPSTTQATRLYAEGLEAAWELFAEIGEGPHPRLRAARLRW